MFMGCQTQANLVNLEMVHIDIILGMMSTYHAILNCHPKKVATVMLGMDKHKWEGDYSTNQIKLISFIHTQRLIGRVFLAFLAHL